MFSPNAFCASPFLCRRQRKPGAVSKIFDEKERGSMLSIPKKSRVQWNLFVRRSDPVQKPFFSAVDSSYVRLLWRKNQLDSQWNGHAAFCLAPTVWHHAGFRSFPDLSLFAGNFPGRVKYISSFQPLYYLYCLLYLISMGIIIGILRSWI